MELHRINQRCPLFETNGRSVSEIKSLIPESHTHAKISQVVIQLWPCLLNNIVEQ